MTSDSLQSKRLGAGLLRSTLGPLLALGVVVFIFAAAEAWQPGPARFLTAVNVRTIAVQTSTVAVAALGMTIVIIAGGIDLSAGTALALCATVLAYGLRENYGTAAAIALGIGAGCAAGMVNGLLISALRVVPFIVTLGTMTVWLGLAKLISGETTVRPLPSQVPAWLPALVTLRPYPEWLVSFQLEQPAPPLPFKEAPTYGLPNVASGVWIALALAVALSCVLRYTVFGRHVFALGSNEATARLCGVNVPLVKVAVYTLAGLFVGIAGMYQFARLTSGNPTSGVGMELRIIAAVVIGGGSLSGGQGSVLGTLTGAAIMAVIASGCTLLGVSNPIQDIVIGAIIIAAVTLDQIRQRRLAV